MSSSIWPRCAPDTAQPKVLAPADPVSALSRLTQAAFAALTAHYGQAERTADRVDFEVTFMTKSYVDGGITIPAWANRDGRKPTSMQQRPEDPMRYERSITADIYRAEMPEMRLISDTSDPQANYAEIYPDQRQRIRSSVVYPILSSEYELLGTLVLHCDKAGFFLEEDRKFWRDFCESVREADRTREATARQGSHSEWRRAAWRRQMEAPTVLITFRYSVAAAEIMRLDTQAHRNSPQPAHTAA